MPQTWKTPTAFRTLLLLATFAALGVPSTGAAAAPLAAPPEPLKPAGVAGVRIDDLSWIAGHWAGMAEGGPIEEIWLPPAAGAMVGMFRWTKEGKVIVYELLALERSAEGPVLVLRHFAPGLKGYEEKDGALLFPLTASGPREATFSATDPSKPTKLVFHRIDERKLRVTLWRLREGKPSTEEFLYDLQGK